MATQTGDTITDLIGEVLRKGQFRSTHNQRACMIGCMNVDDARGDVRILAGSVL